MGWISRARSRVPDEVRDPGEARDPGAVRGLGEVRDPREARNPGRPVAAARPRPPTSPSTPPPYVEFATHAPRTGAYNPDPPRLPAFPTALPGIRIDAGLAGDRWVAAGSLTGQGHLAGGTTAQDAYAITVSDDGAALVLAVCDGLGSRERTSQIGAELFARFACARTGSLTVADCEGDAGAIGTALTAAGGDLLRCRDAEFPQLTDADLRFTTLLCRLPLAPDANRATVVRVGDCEAFLVRGAEYDAIFPGTERGPTNLVRAALPNPEPQSLMQAGHFDPAAADLLILATDGLANDLFDSPRVRDWLARRWAAPCGPAWMLDSLRYHIPGSHDDRTAVVVWLRRWPPDARVGDVLGHR